MRFEDNITNFVAQLGTYKAKSSHDHFTGRIIEMRELWNLYRHDWLGRKIVDAPIFDMLREWRKWEATPAQATAIETTERAFQVRNRLARAMRFGRLFGGGAVIIGADVARPDEPLNVDSIPKGGLKYLTAVSRYQLPVAEIDRDMTSPTFDQPLFYSWGTDQGAVRIHNSRVLRVLGADRLEPNFEVDGWSDSTLLSIYDSIHHAALSTAGVAELIHEAKVDIIQIQNLSNSLMTAEGTRQISARFTNANMVKSLTNMLLLDEKEVFNRHQTQFTGFPDIIDRFMQIVSGASDIPATRLLSQAPKGMNSTGENDVRNYYDMLVGVRDDIIGSQMEYLDRILWRHATGSNKPDSAVPTWLPMWQLTPAEKAAIGYQKAQTTQIYVTQNIMPEEALREGVQNQLIEDGTYPGLEAAIAKLQSAGIDPFEVPPEEDQANDNPQANQSNTNSRARRPSRA